MLLFTVNQSTGQENHQQQTDFSIESFSERRTKLLNATGNNAIALIQGVSGRAEFSVFCQ